MSNYFKIVMQQNKNNGVSTVDAIAKEVDRLNGMLTKRNIPAYNFVQVPGKITTAEQFNPNGAIRARIRASVQVIRTLRKTA